MKNIDVDVEDGIMTIVIDLKKRFGHSSSGKTKIVASSQGPSRIKDHPSLSLNMQVYEKIPKDQQKN